MNAMQRQAARKSGRPAGYPRVGAFVNGGKVDGQTMNDNKVADMQGAARATPAPAPAPSTARADQGVRPATTPATGVPKSAIGKTQDAIYRSLYGR